MALNPLRIDPTRTSVLRRQYSADMRRRFNQIRKDVIKLIDELDVFGLKPRKSFVILQNFPAARAWEFRSSSQKLEEFERWLQTEIDTNVLELEAGGDIWSSKYVNSAYRKGSIRAYTRAHSEALGETSEFFRGRKSQFIDAAFNQPERISKLKFAYTRSFEELKGISNAMSQQLGRVLADGLAQGSSPRTIARTMSNTITGITRQRALVLARTEVVAAHAEGQLDTLEELGIDEVRVLVEWDTSGVNVCPLCQALEGLVVTIKEARGMIPRHPNCKCSWLPADVGEKRKKSIEKIAGADSPTSQKKLKRSLKAGLPKKTRAGKKVPQTVSEAKKRSTWVGKEEVE